MMNEPMIAISKELRDRLLGYSPYMYQGDIDALRDAPETVSLEGVDTSNHSFRESLCVFSDGDYSWGRLDLVVAFIQRLVAPVQSGVPDLMERWRKFLLSSSVGSEWWQMHHNILEKLAHLTTTQSAPSVGSVPSILELEQVILPIWYGDSKGKPYEISNAIHALLTSSTEGKR